MNRIEYKRTLSTECIGNGKTFNFSGEKIPIVNLRIKNYGTNNAIFIPSSVKYFFYRGKPCNIFGGVNLEEINVPHCILDQFCTRNLDRISICGTGTNNYINCNDYKTKKIDHVYNIRLFTFANTPLYFDVPENFDICVEFNYDQQFIEKPGYYKSYNGVITLLDKDQNKN